MGEPKISPAELEVMNIVWDRHPIDAASIASELAPQTGWTQRTVKSMLFRLEKKGALTHTEAGRSFQYSPAIEKSSYIEQESRTFLERFYGGALDKMVAAFVSEGNLTSDEVERLRKILNGDQG